MGAAARGTNAGMERWAETLLLSSLTKRTVQFSMLSCLNITFSVGLQLPPFSFAVVGWLATRGACHGSLFSGRRDPVALLLSSVLMCPRKLLLKIWDYSLRFAGLRVHACKRASSSRCSE